MKLLDLITAPWAIMPDRFLQIVDIYNAHVRGPKIDLDGIEAAIGRPLGNARSYEATVIDGVAVIDVEGPMAKRMSTVNRVCEGTSTTRTTDLFLQAINDPEVKSIILVLDSPGGAVDGTMDLAREVFNARGKKPMASLADGLMCSAAYWVGAATGRVYLANETTMVGSIGVVATHVDVSQAAEKAGIVVSEITAGKYKRATSSYKPLSDEGRASMQEMVDDIYTLFVQDISTFRGVSVDTVLEDMAEGRVFMGQKAIDVGLADGVSSLGALIAEMSGVQAGRKPGAGAALNAVQPTTPSQQEDPMSITREELEAQAPELANTLRAEGAEAERTRIQGVQDQALPGHEALISALAFDGTTTPGAAAMAVNAAEKAKRGTALERIKAEAPKPLDAGGDPTGGSEGKTPKEQFEANADLRKEFGSLAAYEGFLNASASGQARIYNPKR